MFYDSFEFTDHQILEIW